MAQRRAARNVAGVDLRCTLRRPGVQDALIALVFTVSVVLITQRIDMDESEAGRHLDGLAYAAMVVGGGALALRHRLPRGHLAIVLAATVVYVLRDYTGGPFFLAVFIAIGTVASILPTRQALGPTVAAVATLALAGFVVDSEETSGAAHLLYLSWSILAFLAGKAVRDRRELLAGLRERNRHLEETREEEARRQVAEERVRIARDLHDIVAHNIAGISLQAATGAHVAGAHPDQARMALVAIREASRQTLDELRSTLHLLRQGDDEAPLAPAPGLDALPDLVGSVSATGIPVSLELAGEVADVPEAVAGSAYRIVQESLTNVMRHAGAASAEVRVERRADGLALRVVDDGRGGPAVPDDGRPAGHGIGGMRERAAALGGTVHAGPGAGGGWTVDAWLPVAFDPADPDVAPQPEAARSVQA